MTSIKKACLIYLFFLGGLLATGLFAAPVAAEELPFKTIEVVETSKVEKGDVAAAREAAIAKALSSAVTLAADELLATRHQGMQAKNAMQKVLSGASEKYVKGFKVLSESLDMGAYRVAIEATIAMKLLSDRITASQNVKKAVKRSRLLLLLSEKYPNETDSRWGWQRSLTKGSSALYAALTERLFDEKYLTINPNEIENGGFLRATDRIDHLTAQRIGRQLNADLVIVGNAVAELESSSGGGQSLLGNVTLRAINIQTGHELARAHRNGRSHTEDIPKDAPRMLAIYGDLALKDLLGNLGRKVERRPKGAKRIGMIIEGTRDLPTFVHFRKLLGGLPGVKRIHIREMTIDKAHLQVDYKGDTLTLVQALKRAKAPIDGKKFKIAITRASHNRLRIMLGRHGLK